MIKVQFGYLCQLVYNEEFDKWISVKELIDDERFLYQLADNTFPYFYVNVIFNNTPNPINSVKWIPKKYGCNSLVYDGAITE